MLGYELKIRINNMRGGKRLSKRKRKITRKIKIEAVIIDAYRGYDEEIGSIEEKGGGIGVFKVCRCLNLYPGYLVQLCWCRYQKVWVCLKIINVNILISVGDPKEMKSIFGTYSQNIYNYGR